jgi:hypothetical protein
MVASGHAEVGVLKVVVVLEPISHQPVEGDMGEPDQAEPQNERAMLPPRQTDDQGRYRCGMGKVVDEGPDPDAAQVPIIARSGSRTATGTSHHCYPVVA